MSSRCIKGRKKENCNFFSLLPKRLCAHGSPSHIHAAETTGNRVKLRPCGPPEARVRLQPLPGQSQVIASLEMVPTCLRRIAVGGQTDPDRAKLNAICKNGHFKTGLVAKPKKTRLGLGCQTMKNLRQFS